MQERPRPGSESIPAPQRPRCRAVSLAKAYRKMRSRCGRWPRAVSPTIWASALHSYHLEADPGMRNQHPNGKTRGQSSWPQEYPRRNVCRFQVVQLTPSEDHLRRQSGPSKGQRSRESAIRLVSEIGLTIEVLRAFDCRVMISPG